MVGFVVVTRNGEGDFWGFPSAREARLSPIAQAYDVFAQSAEELVSQYRGLAALSLVRLLPQGRERDAAESTVRLAEKSGRPVPTDLAERLWGAAKKAARMPPREPEALIRIIAEDRQALEQKSIRSFSPPEPDPPRSNRTQAAPRARKEVDNMARKRINEGSVITVATPADKPNPKRPGSKSFGRFELYQTGMTVAEAKKAGVSAGDIAYDSEHGYITLEEPAPTAEDSKEAA